MAINYRWGISLSNDAHKIEDALYYFRKDTGNTDQVYFYYDAASDVLGVIIWIGDKRLDYMFFTRQELADGVHHREFRNRLVKLLDKAKEPAPPVPMMVDFSLDELEQANAIIKELT